MAETDRIELRGLAFRAFHGVLAAERRDGQDFRVDVVLELDLTAAAASDALADTVDYGALAAAVVAAATEPAADLIETVAGRVARVCLGDPRVAAVTVTLHKPAAPIGRPVDDVVVALRRERAGTAGTAGTARAVWSIGSNQGDRRDHLQAAVDLLASFDGMGVDAVSPVYETAPWGRTDQPDFLNAVVLTSSPHVPAVLLGLAHVIETARDRVRELRWGPRTLDVDLIDMTPRPAPVPGLDLPHPRAAVRGFVLVPWLDVDPDARLTGVGPVAELVAGLAADVSGLRRRDDLALNQPPRPGTPR